MSRLCWEYVGLYPNFCLVGVGVFLLLYLHFSSSRVWECFASTLLNCTLKCGYKCKSNPTQKVVDSLHVFCGIFSVGINANAPKKNHYKALRTKLVLSGESIRLGPLRTEQTDLDFSFLDVMWKYSNGVNWTRDRWYVLNCSLYTSMGYWTKNVYLWKSNV